MLSTRVTQILAIAALLLMAAMVVAALYNMRRGSLDDLPADEIKKRVG